MEEDMREKSLRQRELNGAKSYELKQTHKKAQWVEWSWWSWWGKTEADREPDHEGPQ